MSIVIQNQPFQFIKAITLSDVTDNLYGVRYLQNVGTAGKVVIRQQGTYGDVDIYLLTGQTIDTGQQWAGAKATGTGAGVDLRAFV